MIPYLQEGAKQIEKNCKNIYASLLNGGENGRKTKKNNNDPFNDSSYRIVPDGD